MSAASESLSLAGGAVIQPLDTDPKVMALKFREYMESQNGGIRELQNTSSSSLDEIAAQITATKAEARIRKEAMRPKKYVPPGGWKQPDPEWLAALPPGKADPVEKAKKIVTIAKYREMQKPRVWDSCMYPSAALQKMLWRRTESDGSGRRIFNLSREAYPKDIPAQWKPGTFDQDLPDPSLELTTHSFRDMLVRHVEQGPVRVAKEVKTLPSKCTAENNYRARVMGELHAMERMRDSVKEELEDVRRKEEEYAASLRRMTKRKTAPAGKDQ